jgi:hypothetical protein
VRATERTVQVGGAAVVVAAAVVAAVCEAFLVPFRLFGVALPLAAALAAVANWALAWLAVWWTGTRWAVLLPAAVWFAVVLAGATPTAGGSIVIISTGSGYALLLAGTAGIAVSMYQHLRASARRGRPAPTITLKGTRQ